jgi:hypothetical protein
MAEKMALGHVTFRNSPFSFVTSFHHNFAVILNLEGQGVTLGNIQQRNAPAAIWQQWTTHLFHFLL